MCIPSRPAGRAGIAGLVLVACGTILVAAMVPVPALSFPKVPHVDNLTEGFRVEKTFASIAVAPTDPERIYLGTRNGYVYTSGDGGETWDQHDLTVPPELSRFPLRPRTGMSLKMDAGMATFATRRYASGYGWPGEKIWTFDLMLPSEILRPGSFRPRESIRSDITMIDQFAGETFNQLFTRDLRFGDTPRMAPVLGFGRKLFSRRQRSGTRLEISWLEVHPERPETVFAVTNDGLWRSNDGGYSWKREFDHALAAHRVTRYLGIDPNDPSIRFLCTDKGLYVTRDAGVSYSKVEAPILNRLGCHWVAFHPDRPRELWVGAVFGVWVSENFGENFDLRFYTRVPGQTQIQQVEFDPENPRNILLASKEIVFLSRDGGESFERVGVYSFANQRIVNVAFGAKPGHLLVATERDVWRSRDWGQTWQSVIFGNVGWHIQRAFFPRGRSDSLWLLTEGELLVLRRRRPRGMSGREGRRLRELFEREPSISRTIIRALRVHRVWRPRRNAYRRRARTAHLVPKLQIVGTYRNVRGNFVGRGFLYGRPGPMGQYPPGRESLGDFRDWHFEIWANWDLADVIFDRRSTPTGENFRYNEELARSIRESIQLIYAERRRLQIKRIVEPSESVRTRALRRLRIEELTELLDVMTRGWFSRYVHERPDLAD